MVSAGGSTGSSSLFVRSGKKAAFSGDWTRGGNREEEPVLRQIPFLCTLQSDEPLLLRFVEELAGAGSQS